MKIKRPALFGILTSIITIIFALILTAGIYVATVFAKYYRINDNQNLEIFRDATHTNIKTGQNYKIEIHNVGFGAYDDQYDFFMDDGFADTEGKIKIHGTHARATDKNHVYTNINGIIELAKSFTPDFILLQEVDINSTRSYHVNQENLFTAAFPEYSYSKAINYHSSYLCYPLNQPIGKSNSELLTLSKARASSSIRNSLPLSDSKFANIIDLDRCIMINRYDVENSKKELVVINVHMSAYDKGGKIRRLQTEMLGKILADEKEKGNYVIIGGDFNQVLIPEGEKYFIKPNGGEITPTWVASWEGSFDGYKLIATKDGDSDLQVGTARNNTKAFNPDWTYTCVIDGFIVSDNISVKNIKNITSHAFKYSDHNPVVMEFELK